MSGMSETGMPNTSSPLTSSFNETVAKSASLALIPSPRDLVLFPIRALQHAETFAFNTVPRHLGRMVGMGDINLNLWPNPVAAGGDGGVAAGAVAAATEAAAGPTGGVAQVAAQAESWYITEFMNTVRKIGGFFGYLTSVWSMACLAEVSLCRCIS